MSYKPIDNKRDQFRKYLESTGVIEVLSKSITKLMERQEKPESPVEFIRESMGLSHKELNQIEFWKEEVEAYKKQVADLKKEIAGLKSERKEVENTLTSEVVNDDNKVEIVADTKIENSIEAEIKSEEIPQSAQVSENGKTGDDTQKMDISNEVKAIDTNSIEVSDEKIIVNQGDNKIEEKPATPSAGDATESVEKLSHQPSASLMSIIQAWIDIESQSHQQGNEKNSDDNQYQISEVTKNICVCKNTSVDPLSYEMKKQLLDSFVEQSECGNDQSTASLQDEEQLQSASEADIVVNETRLHSQQQESYTETLIDSCQNKKILKGDQSTYGIDIDIMEYGSRKSEVAIKVHSHSLSNNFVGGTNKVDTDVDSSALNILTPTDSNKDEFSCVHAKDTSVDQQDVSVNLAESLSEIRNSVGTVAIPLLGFDQNAEENNVIFPQKFTMYERNIEDGTQSNLRVPIPIYPVENFLRSGSVEREKIQKSSNFNHTQIQCGVSNNQTDTRSACIPPVPAMDDSQLGIQNLPSYEESRKSSTYGHENQESASGTSILGNHEASNETTSVSIQNNKTTTSEDTSYKNNMNIDGIDSNPSIQEKVRDHVLSDVNVGGNHNVFDKKMTSGSNRLTLTESNKDESSGATTKEPSVDQQDVIVNLVESLSEVRKSVGTVAIPLVGFDQNVETKNVIFPEKFTMYERNIKDGAQSVLRAPIPMYPGENESRSEPALISQKEIFETNVELEKIQKISTSSHTKTQSGVSNNQNDTRSTFITPEPTMDYSQLGFQNIPSHEQLSFTYGLMAQCLTICCSVMSKMYEDLSKHDIYPTSIPQVPISNLYAVPTAGSSSNQSKHETLSYNLCSNRRKNCPEKSEQIPEAIVDNQNEKVLKRTVTTKSTGTQTVIYEKANKILKNHRNRHHKKSGQRKRCADNLTDSHASEDLDAFNKKFRPKRI